MINHYIYPCVQIYLYIENEGGDLRVADKKSSKESREEKFAKNNNNDNGDNGNATLRKGMYSFVSNCYIY